MPPNPEWDLGVSDPLVSYPTVPPSGPVITGPPPPGAVGNQWKWGVSKHSVLEGGDFKKSKITPWVDCFVFLVSLPNTIPYSYLTEGADFLLLPSLGFRIIYLYY